MNIEKLRFCNVPTALEEIRAGRILAIVDDEREIQMEALVMASAEPSPDALKFMASSTGGFLFMAVPHIDLSKARLPETLVDNFVLGAVFPEILRCDSSNGLRGITPLKFQIIPFTPRNGGVLQHPRPAGCVTDLAELAGGGMYCFFSTFNGDRMTSAKSLFCNAVVSHSLSVLSISELIRYRFKRKVHQSRPTLPVKSGPGDFESHCLESDVFDQC